MARAGLFEACLRFNPDAGSFTAFASVTVSGLLKRHFRDHTWAIRPPRRTQELSLQLWHQWPDLVQAARSEPTNRQIAELINVPVDEVREARDARRAYRADSLNADLDHSVEHGHRDREQSEAHLVVASAWAKLSEKEQRLLVMRFYEDRRQTDIAAELGVSQMQVSRLLDRLMAKLRRIIGPLDEPSTAA